MTKIEQLAEKIFEKYGNIKRARGPYLYTEKGVRLLDLFQENGRAILGWGGSSAFTMLKNSLNRGFTGSFKTSSFYRLQKSVSELLSGERKVFVYYKKEDAEKVSRDFFGKDAAEYKPWAENLSEVINSDAVIFEPCLPWTEGIFLLAVKAEYAKDVPHEKIPAPLEEAVTRSVYNLISAIQYRSEKDWFIYDQILTKYWLRKGPYLFPKVPESKYEAFTDHCLSLGICINPEYKAVSIVPFGADKGALNVLKKNPFEF